MTTDGIAIRRRTDDDLPRCAAIAQEVYELDGYPSFLGDRGLDHFIDPDDALDRWVATIDGEVAGMVCLRPYSARASGELAARALEVDVGELGFVARLEVAPAFRRRGVGRVLLDTVVADARRRGLTPVLDVVRDDRSALALYEASGWRRLGDHELALPDGRSLRIVVLAAP